ncbi:MAG: GNAT family N-acetyltransferase [Promethearchaeota archaeon]
MVDIVVDPEHQGRGLGRQIMEKIMEYIDINAPDESYISMIADIPEYIKNSVLKDALQNTKVCS